MFALLWDSTASPMARLCRLVRLGNGHVHIAERVVPHTKEGKHVRIPSSFGRFKTQGLQVTATCESRVGACRFS